MVSRVSTLSHCQLCNSKVCYFQVSGEGFDFIFSSQKYRTGVFHWRTASESYKLIYKPQNDPLIFTLSHTLRFMSTSPNQHSFTVSYLINKLGFSPESALKTSRYVRLKTPYKPDSVISCLEKHGFSKSQIKTMVEKKPSVLASDVENTFSPKLNFFLSKGFSNPDLTTLLCSNPAILLASLERKIIPFFSTCSEMIHSDEKTVLFLRRHPKLMECDVDFINTQMLSNINVLRDHGVPESNILKLLYRSPSSLLRNPGSFKEAVEKLEEIGLNPLVRKFIDAVSVLAGLSESKRETKVDAFKKWGWSEKEIWECFRRHPKCFKVTEGRITAIMDFLVNKMGLDSYRIVNDPRVLTGNFRRRIVRRGLFAQHLLSKGLIKEDFNLSSLFGGSEKNFLKRFVLRHEAEAPELLKLYKANSKM